MEVCNEIMEPEYIWENLNPLRYNNLIHIIGAVLTKSFQVYLFH